MVDTSIVNETSLKANWNRQADRLKDGQDHVLSQAHALNKNSWCDKIIILPLSGECEQCSINYCVIVQVYSNANLGSCGLTCWYCSAFNIEQNY